MRRENTFRLDFSGFPAKPPYEKVHTFIRQVLGLKKEDVVRIQCHRGEHCTFVKVSDLALAQKIVDEHDSVHEVEIGGKKNKLRITLEDGSVEVKIHDLPEDVSEEKIAEFLSEFGEVMSLTELTWGENFEFGGIPLGIWSARMLIRKNIDSWVTIEGQQAYIAYKGQILSCKHCKEQAHTGISCVQNKKLLVQKSYANVTKQTGQRRPQKKAAARGSSSSQPVEQKSTAPPPPPTLDEFPTLPTSPSQNEPSDSATRNETVASDQTTSPCPQNQGVQNTGSSHQTQTEAAKASKISVALDDLFKKPITRSKSKSDNGNDTDGSSTSTSSRKNRGRQYAKKLRRDDGSDEQMEQ